eukprot:TRINITY_DN12164_c0_g1_i1.p1 TRINITY_DN12164_c0_g1~~TRINITY_DN12164_c0_g1_i1.p1  ORF type:complete len:123 (+),score=13.32 TRINITY_DN12164_c0_g1_i1:219-587(+)
MEIIVSKSNPSSLDFEDSSNHLKFSPFQSLPPSTGQPPSLATISFRSLMLPFSILSVSMQVWYRFLTEEYTEGSEPTGFSSNKFLSLKFNLSRRIEKFSLVSLMIRDDGVFNKTSACKLKEI